MNDDAPHFGVRESDVSAMIDRRFGPVHLAPGVSPWNATTYVFAAFITIGMLAFVSFIQPYLLNANLQVPDAQQGRALGLLGLSLIHI